jgi:hypothetical protein
MAMAANKVADTSRLAEARRAELDWAAGKESAIVSGDKRGLQENRQFTRPAGLSPEDWHTIILCGSPHGATLRQGDK